MTPGASERYYLFDRLIIGYCLLMVALLVVLGRPLTAYVDELIFYAAMAGLVVAIGYYLDKRRSRLAHMLRLLYPVLLFTGFYRMTGGTMFLFFDQFFDTHLTAFELAIFGVHPTVYIDQHLLNVFLNELFSACYFLYYPMIPVFMALVYIRGDYKVIRSSMAAVSLTFFVSYLLFSLYPVEGPRWFFMGQYANEIQGPFFREAVNSVIRHGAVRGGCMPSSHFGVALVLVLYSARHYKKWLWLMIPVTTGLAIGTVWGRFHYVSDVVVGGAIAVVATLLAWKFENFTEDTGTVRVPKKELRTNYAS